MLDALRKYFNFEKKSYPKEIQIFVVLSFFFNKSYKIPVCLHQLSEAIPVAIPLAP